MQIALFSAQHGMNFNYRTTTTTTSFDIIQLSTKRTENVETIRINPYKNKTIFPPRIVAVSTRMRF